jgi:hypothetical protein
MMNHCGSPSTAHMLHMLIGVAVARTVARRLHPFVQAVLEPQQRHGFCVSVELSRQLAATTLQLMSRPATDLPDAQRPHTPEQGTEAVVMHHPDAGSTAVF